MSGMLRLTQATSDHHRGTLLSVIDGGIESRGPHHITVAEADDLIVRGLAEWIAMPAALQEARLVKLESLGSKVTAALEDVQRRLDEQTQRIAELRRHAGLQGGTVIGEAEADMR